MLPRGGGTALGGQTANTALVIDFSKYMNAIARIDADRRVAIVQPGVVQTQLNAAAAQYGLFFAPDPSTKDRCTIGGMIGNNSCGAHSAAHGKTVDNVEGLDAVLYDGTRMTLGGAGDASRREFGKRAHRRVAAECCARSRIAMAMRSARAIRKFRGASRATISTNCCRRTASTWRARWSDRKAHSRLSSGRRCGSCRSPSISRWWCSASTMFFCAADQMPWMLEHRPQALEGFDHHLPDIARQKGIAAVNLLPAGRAFLLVELGGDIRRRSPRRGGGAAQRRPSGSRHARASRC